jgi:hypothetical protein
MQFWQAADLPNYFGQIHKNVKQHALSHRRSCETKSYRCYKKPRLSLAFSEIVNSTWIQNLFPPKFHVTWFLTNLIKHYAMKAYGEWMYRSKFSWPRHYLKVSGQLHAMAALPSGKEPWLPIAYEVEWSPEPVRTMWRKFLTLPGTRTPNPRPSSP